MKTSIYRWDFIDAFKNLRPNNFTYDGLNALWSWITEMEEESGEEYELNVIELCCEFTEYQDIEEINEVYSDYNFKTIDDITEYTVVIISKSSIILGDF